MVTRASWLACAALFRVIVLAGSMRGPSSVTRSPFTHPHPTPLPVLVRTAFPRLERRAIETLQLNLGYRCNQSCVHCHVNAGPNRTEEMTDETVDAAIRSEERRVGKEG